MAPTCERVSTPPYILHGNIGVMRRVVEQPPFAQIGGFFSWTDLFESAAGIGIVRPAHHYGHIRWPSQLIFRVMNDLVKTNEAIFRRTLQDNEI